MVRGTRSVAGNTHGQEEGDLQGLLLRPEPPLCARAGRAVRDLPPQRGPTAAPRADAVRVSLRAPRARGVGVPDRSGAGGAARLSRAPRAVAPAPRARRAPPPAGEGVREQQSAASRRVYLPCRPAKLRQRRGAQMAAKDRISKA